MPHELGYPRELLGRDSTTRIVEQLLVEDERGKPLDRATAWGVGRDLYLAQDRQVWTARASLSGASSIPAFTTRHVSNA